MRERRLAVGVPCWPAEGKDVDMYIQYLECRAVRFVLCVYRESMRERDPPRGPDSARTGGVERVGEWSRPWPCHHVRCAVDVVVLVESVLCHTHHPHSAVTGF